LPCLALPCLAAPCHALPRPAAPRRAVPSLAAPCRALPCRAGPGPALSSLGPVSDFKLAILAAIGSKPYRDSAFDEQVVNLGFFDCRVGHERYLERQRPREGQYGAFFWVGYSFVESRDGAVKVNPAAGIVGVGEVPYGDGFAVPVERAVFRAVLGINQKERLEGVANVFELSFVAQSFWGRVGVVCCKKRIDV